jgi:hypothetical protein
VEQATTSSAVQAPTQALIELEESQETKVIYQVFTKPLADN